MNTTLQEEDWSVAAEDEFHQFSADVGAFLDAIRSGDADEEQLRRIEQQAAELSRVLGETLAQFVDDEDDEDLGNRLSGAYTEITPTEIDTHIRGEIGGMSVNDIEFESRTLGVHEDTTDVSIIFNAETGKTCTGGVVSFSPEETRQLATALLRAASYCEGEQPPRGDHDE